jgi:threonine/homoserine/homoserine lactone efflux protein
MSVTQSLVAFFLAAGLLTITPGLDTAMVLRAAAVEGPRRAVHAAIGICLGCLVWGAAVALGLGALLAASELGYTILRWAGALYLGYLGLQLLLRPRTQLHTPEAPDAADRSGGWLVRGCLSNLLNPKVGVFYVTFLPQFVPPGQPVGGYTFLLACIHVVQGALWFALLIAASTRVRRVLGRPSVVRALDRTTGVVFLAFGAKLALSRR